MTSRRLGMLDCAGCAKTAAAEKADQRWSHTTHKRIPKGVSDVQCHNCVFATRHIFGVLFIWLLAHCLAHCLALFRPHLCHGYSVQAVCVTLKLKPYTRRLSAQSHWGEMLWRQHPTQEVGACISHAAQTCVSQSWHVGGVQINDDEVELVPLDFVDGRAVAQADREVD